MIEYRFNQTKATQVAGAFLRAYDGNLNYMKLIKLMYLADRLALTERGSPVIGDRYVSMAHGPVMSHVYDLIRGRERDSSYWDQHITRAESDNYNLELKSDPGSGDLSRRELRIIDDVAHQFRELNQYEMAIWCHDNCREWQDPSRIQWTGIAKRSVDIQVEEIFEALGMPMSEADLTAMEDEAMMTTQSTGWPN